jgi:hypothetical protein
MKHRSAHKQVGRSAVSSPAHRAPLIKPENLIQLFSRCGSHCPTCGEPDRTGHKISGMSRVIQTRQTLQQPIGFRTAIGIGKGQHIHIPAQGSEIAGGIGTGLRTAQHLHGQRENWLSRPVV